MNLRAPAANLLSALPASAAVEMFVILKVMSNLKWADGLKLKAVGCFATEATEGGEKALRQKALRELLLVLVAGAIFAHK